MKNILITGASGFIGQHLVQQLLKTTTHRLFLLIRQKGARSAVDRCKRIFASHSDLVDDRIIPLTGDISQPFFGLGESKFKEIGQDIQVIYHVAASIKFNLPYDEAYKINVNGTKNCLTLASIAESNFERFHHVSTAYVNTSLEDGERDFNNTYESTKYKAEQLFKDTKIPFTIYRPSIVAGASKTGDLASSSIIYKFMVLLSKNLLNIVPADAKASLNIIPVVNFVNKMLAIGASEKSLNQTFHITHQRNTNFQNLLETASVLLKATPPTFVSNDEIKKVPKQVLNHLDTFLPYISQSQEFQSEQLNIIPESRIPCDDVMKTIGTMVAEYKSNHATPKI